MTIEQLRDELKKSMLARDEERTSALRMLLSAVGYYEIQKGGAGYSATSEDILHVIGTEAKKIRDSIEQFKAGGRDEMAQKEERGLAVLQEFLPAQFSEIDVRNEVMKIISEVGASSPSDMGKVMSAVMEKLKGKADGSLVSKVVREELVVKS